MNIGPYAKFISKHWKAILVAVEAANKLQKALSLRKPAKGAPARMAILETAVLEQAKLLKQFAEQWGSLGQELRRFRRVILTLYVLVFLSVGMNVVNLWFWLHG